MSQTNDDDNIARFFNDPDAVTNAIQTGINAALLQHKQMGYPICVWRDGKVVWIASEEIRVNRKD